MEETQRGEKHRYRETEGEKKRGKEGLGKRENTLYSPLIIVEPPYSKYCWTTLASLSVTVSGD